MTPPKRRPIQLICDWDGTLTKQDTLHLVAKVAYYKIGLPLDGEASSYPAPAVSWRTLGNAYQEAYDRHKENYQPEQSQRKTLAEERRWLASLKDVELTGVKGAEEAEIFKAVTAAGVESGATAAVQSGNIMLRPGWLDLVDMAVGNDPKAADKTPGSFEILSVNWSRTFIRSAILASLTKHTMTSPETARRVDGYLKTQMVVHANEISGLHYPDGSSGRLCDSGEIIRTSADKLDILPTHCHMSINANERVPPRESQALVVYVGDSDTDMECLIAADVGICIQDEPLTSAQSRLREMTDRLGISMRHISMLQNEPPVYPSIWTASDFSEIVDAFKAL